MDHGQTPEGPVTAAPPVEPIPPVNPLEETEPDEGGDGDDSGIPSEEEDIVPTRPPIPVKKTRRLSTYESTEGGRDLESGGSARPKSYLSTLSR